MPFPQYPMTFFEMTQKIALAWKYMNTMFNGWKMNNIRIL